MKPDAAVFTAGVAMLAAAAVWLFGAYGLAGAGAAVVLLGLLLDWSRI